MQTPVIEVKTDFDGYFERLTKKIVEIATEMNKPFRFERIEVTAGPYRCDALTINRVDEKTVNMDYYSAIRTGFGRLTEEDLQEAAKLLLV